MPKISPDNPPGHAITRVSGIGYNYAIYKNPNPTDYERAYACAFSLGTGRIAVETAPTYDRADDIGQRFSYPLRKYHYHAERARLMALGYAVIG